MELQGSAIVIGASGIGQACALTFAKYGVSAIVVADLNIDACKAVAAECKAVARNQDIVIDTVVMDVTSEASVEAGFAHAQKLVGRLDFCVNSAGIGVQLARGVAEASLDEFEKMLRVNVTGTFLVTKVASALMKTQDAVLVDHSSPARGHTRGSIVILGSASGVVATPSMVQYTAAKHAVLGITKNAALDNAAHSIRVNSVCPSWVDTPMMVKALNDVPGLGDMIKAAVPMGRMALAEEVADAVMFLCGPMSSYATGCNMILDGGTTLASHHL